jgi:hypothetical protein
MQSNPNGVAILQPRVGAHQRAYPGNGPPNEPNPVRVESMTGFNPFRVEPIY